MNAYPGRSIVVVCDDRADGAEPVAPSLADLLASGLDAHALCGGDGAAAQPGLEGLTDRAVRLRVHPPPRAFRGPLPRAALLAGALRALTRRPAMTLRELRAATDGAARYRRAVLLALEPAIVHFCSLAAAQQYPGAAANARVLVSVVDQDIEAFAVDEREVLDSLAADAGAFHVESDSAAELLAGATERPVVVIPPVPDESLLAMPSRAHGARGVLRILSVGALTWAEGYEYALEAVALLAKRGVPCDYRIVGSGAYADAIAFARWQLGVERMVEVVGACDRSTLREHLAWADVFVSAAVAPRSPRTLLDARAAGLPVVRTSSPPTPDALVVPRRDPEALADSLARVACNPTLRATLAKAGREAASSAIRADERLTRFLGLYEGAALSVPIALVRPCALCRRCSTKGPAT